MAGKTCCIAGHRDLPADALPYVQRELERAVELAIADGYTHFLCDFAPGASRLFAQIVAGRRTKDADLVLEAVLPCLSLYLRLQNDPAIAPVLSVCRAVAILGERHCAGSEIRCCRFMTALSSRIIAVYDGRASGSTVRALRFAHIWERPVYPILIGAAAADVFQTAAAST